jgi:hypothetical protein
MPAARASNGLMSALARLRGGRAGPFPAPPPLPALLAATLLCCVGPTWFGPVTHAISILVEPMRAETPRTLEAAARCFALALPLALLGLRVLKAGRPSAAALAVCDRRGGESGDADQMPAALAHALRACLAEDAPEAGEAVDRAAAGKPDHSECPACVHESGGHEGAVYEAILPALGLARRLGRGAWLGPTFRVVECDCWSRLREGGDPALQGPADVCDFCACTCSRCGGNPIAARLAAEQQRRHAVADASAGSRSAVAAVLSATALALRSGVLAILSPLLPGRALAWATAAMGGGGPAADSAASIPGGPGAATLHAAAAHVFALQAAWVAATALEQVHRLQVQVAVLAATVALASLRGNTRLW